MEMAQKIEKLREYYGNRVDDSARKILDSFAGKSRWRSTSLVHRIAQETQLSERVIRGFLKDKLETELELGWYKKGAQGYKSRFIWDVETGYSLISVGLAAKSQSETLYGGDDEVISQEDEEGGVVQKSLELANSREFKAEFPSDLTEREFDHFTAWFKMVVFGT